MSFCDWRQVIQQAVIILNTQRQVVPGLNPGQVTWQNHKYIHFYIQGLTRIFFNIITIYMILLWFNIHLNVNGSDEAASLKIEIFI